MRSITLGSNIASLQGVRRLSENAAGLSQTFERLSSGMRINHASDDAAGLAVQTSLNLDKRIYSQGIRNINDGISALNIADATLSEASGVVIRLRELAEQASNGTFGTQQRKSLDGEAQALAAEYLRVTRSATFNGLNLFDGSLQGFRVQAGYGSDGSIFSSLGGAIWNGSFGSAVTIDGTQTASELATGDLNGDGFQDLVNAVATGFTLRLGNGDGSFSSETTYDMGSNTLGTVALADMNNDGILDVISGGANAGAAVLGIRLGVGNGTFGSATTFTGGPTSSYTTIAIGDINNDGNMDIAAGGSSSTTAKVGVFLGDGRGGLGAATSYSGTTANTTSVQLADLNNDGLLDLISTSLSIVSPEVNLNLGNGVFDENNPLTYTTGFRESRFADFNGDGNLDIATLNGGTNLLIGFGNGNGTFAAPTTLTLNISTLTDLEIADFNGDGKIDIVADGRFAAMVLIGNGNGTFSFTSSKTLYSSSSSDLALADLNNDGVLDLVTSGSGAGILSTLSQTKDGIGSILGFSLKNMADARQALTQFTALGSRLSAQRGIIGAFQSRVGVASSLLSVVGEQSAAAESRILDVDVAAESAELVRKTILQQVAASILTQANQQPRLALTLLQ